MNARLLGFFSGFPARAFPRDIAVRLHKALPQRGSLVFVSAWPADAARNDSDAAGMHGMFVQWDMNFGHCCVIDDRTESAAAQQLIREADCVFLMGGNATQQMALIREKGVLEAMRRNKAVILGVSAGAINMGRRSLDVWESPVPYEGLGLADITIKAHICPEEPELLRTLQDISAACRLPICAMEDDSAIFVEGGRANFLGRIHWVQEGQVSPLTGDIL